MYCEFFGFSENPFTITPNPHFMYLSSIHREAFARLLYGIESRAGFITLTGEVGTGKTTMLRTLLTRLDPDRYRSALIFNPCMSGDQLLASICSELGIAVEEQSRYGYLESLNRFLIEQNCAGRTVVLVIDEAQNMAPEVLEYVRMISNLETERDKLIQIILAGQPELNILLNRHDLRQLNQRISVRCTLSAMTMNDAADYINHRIRISGSNITDIFSPGAVRRIFRFSGGIPRLINVACEQSLVMAWTEERRSVSPRIAGKIISELRAATRNGIWFRILNWLFAGK